ncbi:hypothetical protein ACWCPQ_26265 [Nocardia sp. NPDC001965]
MNNWPPTGSPHAAPGATGAFPGGSGGFRAHARGRVRTAALGSFDGGPGAAR